MPQRAVPRKLEDRMRRTTNASAPHKVVLDTMRQNPMDDDDDMPNPFAAMDGMKGGMVAMVQNMVMMQGIQYFFSGFILLKASCTARVVS